MVVVVVEELAAVRAGVLDAVEARGERRPVLQRLELRFGVGVVRRGMGPVVGLGDAEIGEQERDRLLVIELPRSACTVSWSRAICCCSQTWAIRSLATWPDSRCWTVQPTA